MYILHILYYNFQIECLTLQNSSYLDFFVTLNVDRNSPTGSFNLILQASFDQNLLTSVNIPYNVITLQPDGIVSVNELTTFHIITNLT